MTLHRIIACHLAPTGQGAGCTTDAYRNTCGACGGDRRHPTGYPRGIRLVSR